MTQKKSDKNPTIIWKYALAPESVDHIEIKKQYDLFINGEFVKPRSKNYYSRKGRTH